MGINILKIIITGLFLASFAFSQSGRVQPSPTPKTEDEKPVRIVTEEIKLNVIAFDEHGSFVGDVSAKDLVITENNILHVPQSVRRIPAHVLIVMDTGGELRFRKNLEHTRKVARKVVSELRAEDPVAIVQYSDQAEVLLEWTKERADISAAIGRSNFGKRSSFVDALKLSAELMSKDTIDNKHIVLITDGTDSFKNTSEKTTALRRMLEHDITFHVISYTQMEADDIEPRTKMVSKSPPPKAMPDEVVAGLPNGVRQTAQAPKIGPVINMDRRLLKTLKDRKVDLDISEELLLELAANTNGEIIIPTTPDEMIERSILVAKMIDASYVVTYTPKLSFEEDRQDRTITVTSKRPGLVVEARRKLIAPEMSR